MNDPFSDLDASKCSGCGACANACPKDAIRLVPDRAGFPMPKVDAGLCIGCNRCRTVCPFRHPTEPKENPLLFAAWRKDLPGRFASSSGGVASLLAERTVADGGIAFGAEFDREFHVRHVAAESLEAVERFRKSKYVQSETGDCFREVESAVKQGRKTIFIGTPCQTAGLLAFLKARPNHLLTIDFLCHGVPSPLLLTKYVKWLENELDGPLEALDFRDKTNGWQVGFSAKSQTRSLTRPADEDPYLVWFLGHHSIRQSCLNCPFRGKRHVSDITVGDFWSHCRTKHDPEAAQGVSKVLVNTHIGRKALQAVQTDLVLEERPFSQSELGPSGPLPIPCSRNSFQRSIPRLDVAELVARFPTRLDRLQKSFRIFRQKTRGWIRVHLAKAKRKTVH